MAHAHLFSEVKKESTGGTPSSDRLKSSDKKNKTKTVDHVIYPRYAEILVFSFIGNSTLRSLALRIGNAFRVTESEPI